MWTVGFPHDQSQGSGPQPRRSAALLGRVTATGTVVSTTGGGSGVPGLSKVIWGQAFAEPTGIWVTEKTPIKAHESITL